MYKVIAITGGKAVSAVVENLQPERAFDVTVVPLTGGVQGKINALEAVPPAEAPAAASSGWRAMVGVSVLLMKVSRVGGAHPPVPAGGKGHGRAPTQASSRPRPLGRAESSQDGKAASHGRRRPGRRAVARSSCFASHLPPEIPQPAPRGVHCARLSAGLRAHGHGGSASTLSAASRNHGGSSAFWRGRSQLPLRGSAGMADPHRSGFTGFPFHPADSDRRNRRTQHIVASEFVNAKCCGALQPMFHVAMAYNRFGSR